MQEIKWDIRRGAQIYRVIYDSRLKSWISTGKIKRGETMVWRSGFSGWRKPEELPELTPFFESWEKLQLSSEKIRIERKNSRSTCFALFPLFQRGRTEDILTKQLARAATSVGAIYRAACRARSRADFVSKITVVEEEADETQYWLKLLLHQSPANHTEILDLLEEAKELTAIFTASGKTAKWGT